MRTIVVLNTYAPSHQAGASVFHRQRRVRRDCRRWNPAAEPSPRPDGTARLVGRLADAADDPAPRLRVVARRPHGLTSPEPDETTRDLSGGTLGSDRIEGTGDLYLGFTNGRGDQ